jgi:hypothetical protein
MDDSWADIEYLASEQRYAAAHNSLGCRWHPSCVQANGNLKEPSGGAAQLPVHHRRVDDQRMEGYKGATAAAHATETLVGVRFSEQPMRECSFVSHATMIGGRQS